MENQGQRHPRPQGQPRSTHHAQDKANAQTPTSQTPTRPTTNNPASWKAYWKKLNQPWRTESEISQERQQELEKRRAIVPDTQQGIYPLKGIPLTRADIEWLLATHHKGSEPFNQGGTINTENESLDLRGADLREVDLHDLPLTRIRGGLSGFSTEEQRLYYYKRPTSAEHNLREPTSAGHSLRTRHSKMCVYVINVVLVLDSLMYNGAIPILLSLIG